MIDPTIVLLVIPKESSAILQGGRMSKDLGVSSCVPENLLDDEPSIRLALSQKLKTEILDHTLPLLLHQSGVTGEKQQLSALRIRERIEPLLEMESLYIPSPYVPSWRWERVGLLGAFGALLGGWLVQSLLGFLFAFPQAGFILGAPLGAFLLIFGVAKLSTRPKVAKTVQFILGSMTVGFTIGGIFSLLRGRWLGNRGVNLVQWFGLAIASFLLIILIRLFQPEKKKDPQERKRSIEMQMQIIKGVLMAYLQTLISKESSNPAADQPHFLWADIMRDPLHNVHRAIEANDPQKAMDSCSGLIEHLYTQGLSPHFPPEPMLYTNETQNHFDLFGMVHEGEPIEMLRMAWVDNAGNTVIKGLVRRAR